MATLIVHKRAKTDLEILETIEAGIVLLGTEGKSLRASHGVLLGAHVIVRGGEVYVVGMQIPAYQPKNAPADYDPARTRKLLLTSAEITQLSQMLDKRGCTAVPLSIYEKGKKLKVSIGIGRGKKKFDKRQDIKKRDASRDIAREVKRGH